jgi:hypothetical protein
MALDVRFSLIAQWQRGRESMGEVIRKTAAIADIVADVRKTHARALARPGTVVAEAAETYLAEVIALVDGVEEELGAAEAAEARLLGALEVADHEADAVVGRNADVIWNAIGRPRSDAAYTLLFPGGVARYTDGDILEQPIRMQVLSSLLRAGVHPKLPKDVAEAAAAEIDAAAAVLGQATEAIRVPRTRVKLLRRTLTALARYAAAQLSRMKQALKIAGMTEAEIHTIIPDRGQPKSKKPDPAPSAT